MNERIIKFITNKKDKNRNEVWVERSDGRWLFWEEWGCGGWEEGGERGKGEEG